MKPLKEMSFSQIWIDNLLAIVDIVIVVKEARIGLKKRFRKNPNEFYSSGFFCIG